MKNYFYLVHQILENIELRPLIYISERPKRGKPHHKRNGIYFMYEKSETFQIEGVEKNRIVYVGINIKDGRLYERLRQYTNTEHFPPLKQKIERALCAKDDKTCVPSSEVNKYFINNITCRILCLPSTRYAERLEQKIVPLLAECSSELVSPKWLGLNINQPFGIWNAHYSKKPCMLGDQDIDILAEAVESQVRTNNLNS